MDAYTYRKKNLTLLIKKWGGATRLAEKLDRSLSQISQLTGTSPRPNIGHRLARSIEKKLELPEGWMDQDHSEYPAVQEESAEHGTQTTIPVYAITASMGRGRFVESEAIIKIVVVNQSTLGEMRLTGTGHGIVAVYADGESMEPTIPPKSIVFVDRNQRDLRDGVYLVRLEDMIYVKRIQRLPDHKLKVISDNPIYKPFDVDLKNGDDFEILGKVVRTWIERTF